MQHGHRRYEQMNLPEIQCGFRLSGGKRSPDDLVFDDVGVKEPLVRLLAVVVEADGSGGVGDLKDVVSDSAVRVGVHDGVVVGEVELHLGLGGAGPAHTAQLDVTRRARALEPAVVVFASLVAVAPFIALVTVCKITMS